MTRGLRSGAVTIGCVLLVACDTGVVDPPPHAGAVATASVTVSSTGVSVEDLGVLGSTSSYGYGIDAAGWVVGHSHTPDAKRTAFVWRGSSPMMALPYPDGVPEHTIARAIHRSAGSIRIVGWSDGSPFRPLWWESTDGGEHWSAPQVLALPAGFEQAVAKGINDAGNLAGTGYATDPSTDHSDSRAVAWPSIADDPVVLHEKLVAINPAYDLSYGNAINSAGQIVGYARRLVSTSRRGATYEFDLFVWTPDSPGSVSGTMEVIPPPTGYTLLRGTDINDVGELAGIARDSRGNDRAARWARDGDGTWQMQVLPTLGGCCNAAEAINNDGAIVGWSEMSRGPQRGFLWRRDGSLVELPALASDTYSRARDVATPVAGGSTLVTGYAAYSRKSSNVHAVRWAVPAP